MNESSWDKHGINHDKSCEYRCDPQDCGEYGTISYGTTCQDYFEDAFQSHNGIPGIPLVTGG